MKLQFIKVESCPHCDCRDVCREENKGHHLSGGDFEVRSFRCGYEIAWSPNFDRLEDKNPCYQDSEHLKKISKRKSLLDDIEALIQKSEVDTSFKRTLRMYLPRV